MDSLPKLLNIWHTWLELARHCNGNGSNHINTRQFWCIIPFFSKSNVFFIKLMRKCISKACLTVDCSELKLWAFTNFRQIEFFETNSDWFLDNLFASQLWHLKIATVSWLEMNLWSKQVLINLRKLSTNDITLPLQFSS